MQATLKQWCEPDALVVVQSHDIVMVTAYVFRRRGL